MTNLGDSMIQHVTLDSPKEATVLKSATFKGQIYDVSVLDESSGLFVAINQDASETENTASVMAGAFNSLTIHPIQLT